MNIKEINLVKEELDRLQLNGLVGEWELPYENLLTRLSAAIFFVTPAVENGADAAVWLELKKYPEFSFRENTEKKLSGLTYRVTFNSEEKEKNARMVVEAE
jgi:hypothetical protein